MLITYTWNLKYDTNVLIYETETGSQTWKPDLAAAKGERKRGWELGISICKLLYIIWINNKVLSQHRSYIHYPGINHKGKEYEKECINICITETLCYTAVMNTTL